MRYDSTRLTGSSPVAVKTRREQMDGGFLMLVLALLFMGLILVLSSSYPRAYAAAEPGAHALLSPLCVSFSGHDPGAAGSGAPRRGQGQRLPPLAGSGEPHGPALGACQARGDPVLFRYDLQLGLMPLPRSTNPAHIKENADLDFVISDEDMKKLGEVEEIQSLG